MLGKLIKNYIDENLLIQRQVAIRAGIKPQILNDICNGRRKVEAMEYFAICEALNLSLDYFANKVKQGIQPVGGE